MNLTLGFKSWRTLLGNSTESKWLEKIQLLNLKVQKEREEIDALITKKYSKGAEVIPFEVFEDMSLYSPFALNKFTAGCVVHKEPDKVVVIIYGEENSTVLEHSHDFDEKFYVISGKLLVCHGELVTQLKAKDTYYLKADENHEVTHADNAVYSVEILRKT